ncbi:MAG: ABC transporter ATP-binding protein [Anaerolineae bacterium]|nr:ABC transporter ATP-binding protein [Anaerolineae bacterium]MDW8097882.1 ABC transporter ATP-binding protein [Anaerolineae bacterium]
MDQPLLEIRDLRVYYRSVRGEYRVVDGVSLSVYRNEIFGLAGESGCGKSTLVEGILRLVRPPGYIKTGEALFHLDDWGAGDRVDLLKLSSEELREIRWKHLSYIPQGSMNSLNPVMRIEDQIIDAITFHSDLSREAARARAMEVLRMVGLSERVARSYPHELSGGMKQRAIIAMAITLQPQLIVADEPTTALDVNVQRAILETIANIKAETGATVLFVSHDMGVHAELVDRLAIMYAGKVMEVAHVNEAFDRPLHPYSQRLIASIPTLGGARVRLEGIPGLAPSPLAWPTGCRFHPRCPHAMEVCKQVEPPLIEVSPGHQVACHLYGNGEVWVEKG